MTEAAPMKRQSGHFSEALRHRVVAAFFGRLFAAVNRTLCPPGQLPEHGIHKILICRPNHRLGNAILISPLLAEVEALYPGAEIDMVSAGHAAQTLFASRFQLRRVFSFPRKIARHLGSSVGLLRQLRENTYDLAIDASNGSQSGRLLLAIVKARFKLGFAEQPAQAGVAPEPDEGPEHFALRTVFLLRTAYAGKRDGGWPELNVHLTDEERRQARLALARIVGESTLSAPERPVVGIFANATGAKHYGEAWWTRFVSTLQALQPGICIVDLVADHGQSQLGQAFPSYYTRDLRRLASMIANMSAFISADCGVMHLAAASGTPTLGLFSVTSAAKYGPYGDANSAIDTATLNAAEAAAIASDWLSMP
ncbi:MAG: lipopolysaccharide heptosyltransferase family protein [Rhodanobacter sp.]|nr:MAG: lipopolysaccharide heptosyltransferase family protein [Rhodanobacter sp.]